MTKEEFLNKQDKNLYRFTNLWPALFAENFPYEANINDVVPFINQENVDGKSIIGVSDGLLENDNGFGRCAHGKCLVDIINMFYPEASIQALNPYIYFGTSNDLMQAEQELCIDYLYKLDFIYEMNDGLNTLNSRSDETQHMTMISFMHQNHDGKAKVYTTSTSSAKALSKENLNTGYGFDAINECRRLRTSWKTFETRAGKMILEESNYDLTLYLENNKEDLNTLVVTSLENNFETPDGTNDVCFEDDPYSNWEWKMREIWTPQCGAFSDTVFKTGNFESHWLMVGNSQLPEFNQVNSTIPGKYYEDSTVFVGGNPIDASTSFSTPIVAALAAKIIDTNSSLTAAEVKKIIINSADVTITKIFDYYDTELSQTIYKDYEAKIVNSDAALLCAVSLDCLFN